MIKRTVLSCLLLSLSIFAAVAQSIGTNDSSLNLSLQDAVTMALERNRTLQNASLDIQTAEAAKWEAISSMLPQLTGKLDYSNYMGYKMELMGASIAMPPYGTVSITTAVAFSAAQLIGAQISNVSIRMANISLKQSEQEITNQVKVLYYSALVAEETVNLLEKNLNSMEKLYEYSQKSVDVGAAEQVSADQIKVQVATMKSTLSSAKRSVEMVYNSIRLALNIDVDTNIHLTQSIDNLMNTDKASSLLAEDLILNNNLSYQLLTESTNISKKQLSIAKWAYAPTISMYYQYSGKKYFSNEPTMNMTPPNMLGASLNIPIFSSGNKYKAVQKAKYAYQKQLNTLADTEMALKVQHRQLKYNLTSAIERLDTQKENLVVSQRVFDHIGNKYQYGVASSLDVTNSGTTLISAQSSYVEALLEYVKAQIELEKLLNR